jgi:hypothetical protein
VGACSPYELVGAPGRIRTCDARFRKPTHLDYIRIAKRNWPSAVLPLLTPVGAFTALCSQSAPTLNYRAQLKVRSRLALNRDGIATLFGVAKAP